MSARPDCFPRGSVVPWHAAMRSAERYGNLADQAQAVAGEVRSGSAEHYRRLERVFLDEAMLLRSRSVSACRPG
jgi:hypothetical protein